MKNSKIFEESKASKKCLELLIVFSFLFISSVIVWDFVKTDQNLFILFQYITSILFIMVSLMGIRWRREIYEEKYDKAHYEASKGNKERMKQYNTFKMELAVKYSVEKTERRLKKDWIIITGIFTFIFTLAQLGIGTINILFPPENPLYKELVTLVGGTLSGILIEYIVEGYFINHEIREERKRWGRNFSEEK